MNAAVSYTRLSQDGKSLDRQENDIEAFAEANGYNLLTVYNEGRWASRFNEDCSEYQALLEHVSEGTVNAVIVPNLSCLPRDHKHRLRLLLDLDETGVAMCSHELVRAVALDDDWELVQQVVTATTDDMGKRKEIERSQRVTDERLRQGFDHSRPPFGLQYDTAGEY